MERSFVGPDLSAQAVQPRYNIQAVEKAAGISARTLRSWERRYGVPRPHRDASGRRLYSERDIALIRWLKARLDEGVAIGRAVTMIGEEAAPSAPTSSTADVDRLQLRLLQGMDWMDESEVARALEDAANSLPLERLVADVIQPVLYRIGALWEAGHLSVASEHFGTEMVRSLLSGLLTRGPQPWRPQHILVGCAPGEQHDVGALILALFLRRAGFRVSYLGANLDAAGLPADLQRVQPHAVCLSASTASSVETLAALYLTLAGSYPGIVGYGGRAFADGGTRDRSVPGMYLGANAEAAVATLVAALEGTDPAA